MTHPGFIAAAYALFALAAGGLAVQAALRLRQAKTRLQAAESAGRSTRP